MTSTAYEGQSGSKDRGDPEVSVSKLVVYLPVSHSLLDDKLVCGQSTGKCD